MIQDFFLGFNFLDGGGELLLFEHSAELVFENSF